MCERAAHSILRVGDCTIEVEGINRQFVETVKAAEDLKQLIMNKRMPLCEFMSVMTR